MSSDQLVSKESASVLCADDGDVEEVSVEDNFFRV